MDAGNHSVLETRQRLLEAAGEIFAEQGFRNATVREICDRAQANIAAVNYHFGDKESLYIAVVQYAHSYALQKFPPDLALRPDATAEERLRGFIRAFLLRILDEGRPAWHGRLMAREMVEPTRALDALVEQSIRPQFEMLSSIVRRLLGPSASDEVVRRCGASVIGQCLHYYHARAVIARINPHLRYTPEDIERLSDHITRFSLGGLTKLAHDGKDGPR
jgi:AcrR family transcriptional regulator